jgi:hypothetical protein
MFVVPKLALRLVYIGDVFKVKMPATGTWDSHYYTCPGHLGRRDKNRNNPISFVLPYLSLQTRF